MRGLKLKKKQSGIAVVEAVLIVVIIAAVIGVAAYAVHQKHTADKTLANTAMGGAQTTDNGTTAAILLQSEQDIKNETNLDNTADASYQQAATGPDKAISNLGGAYNESNF